jgi:hypothetical protein
MILKFNDYIQLNEVVSNASLSDVLNILLPNGWEYSHSNGGDGIKFIKPGYKPVSGHLKHGNSQDSNRKIDPGAIDDIRNILISEFLKDGDPTVINLIPWEQWCQKIKDPFTKELKEYDKETGMKKSDLETLRKIKFIRQIHKNVGLIQNEKGEYNLCKSEEDKSPLLDRWYPLCQYASKPPLNGKLCLGYDYADENVPETKWGTYLFKIKEDGTLGTENEAENFVVESVKKI